MTDFYLQNSKDLLQNSKESLNDYFIYIDNNINNDSIIEKFHKQDSIKSAQEYNNLFK